MDYAHFESVEVSVLSVGMKSSEYAFVTHSNELDDAIFQSLGKSRVRRHQLNELNNFVLLLHVVVIVERRAIRIVWLFLKCGFIHRTESVIVRGMVRSGRTMLLGTTMRRLASFFNLKSVWAHVLSGFFSIHDY